MTTTHTTSYSPPYAIPHSQQPAASTPENLIEHYQNVRRTTEQLCQPLATEDYVVQSMPDASPAKWHLAHTSWFFETFILVPYVPGYAVFNPAYDYLLNSYYVTIGVGKPYDRPRRGLLTRPTVAEVYEYRRYVNDRMLAWMDRLDEASWRSMQPLIELGLHHEQQHQELILTDIKHAFSINPLQPVYAPSSAERASSQGLDFRKPAPLQPLSWKRFDGGLYWIGHDGHGFAYDNESPNHRVFVEPFELASRLVTNGEYLQFIEDGGYRQPRFWLSDGWTAVQEHKWQGPLYAFKQGNQWWLHTLTAVRPALMDEPVCHISYYEADAYARWAHARLSTEAEWEIAARTVLTLCHTILGHFVEEKNLHPISANDASQSDELLQLFGDAWEWTQSPYSPYPGFAPATGALGEYNGKFMCNQFVLRGGSCATPASHMRATYRNFFAPAARWQFTGIRLARSL